MIFKLFFVQLEKNACHLLSAAEEAVHIGPFFDRMVSGAFNACAAECRNTGSFRVGCITAASAEFRARNRESAFFCDFLCNLQKFKVARELRHDSKAYAVIELCRDIRHILFGADFLDLLSEDGEIFRMDVAEIAFHLAVSQSRIGYRAAFDCADIDIVLFGVVGSGSRFQ